MNSKTVLIIEDEPGIADSVIYVLDLEGFTSRWETLGERGVEAVREGGIDLVVLDVGLPDISGLDVCKMLRKFSDIPIIFLTARGDEIDRIVGLEIGADDYLVKPFSPRELAARVKAIFRRGGLVSDLASSTAAEKKVKPALIIEQNKRRANYFGKRLSLTKFEYDILCTLVAAPERVYSREQLLQEVWDYPEESFDRAVDTHIKTLRAKLRKIKPESDLIVTHRGVGYSYHPEHYDT